MSFETKFKLRVAALAVSALCALPALASDAVKVDSAFNAQAMAPKLIIGQSDDNKMVRGIKRVAIGSFDVEFVGSPGTELEFAL